MEVLTKGHDTGENVHVIEKSAADRLDAVMSECCIDDCGFDVHNEDIETLRSCLIEVDRKCREALKEYRGK